jgi:hypothetical protein
VRVRVAPPGVSSPFGVPASDKAISLLLQVAPEPRLRWQQLKAITVEKAIDDNDQKLTKHEPPMPAGGGGFGGPGGVIVFPGGKVMPGWPGGGMNVWSNDNVNHNVQLMLNKGAKASKKLKELSGSILAVFLGEAKAFIVADNVMKAKGKTFKGADGSITIKAVNKDKDGVVKIEFEFTQPKDIVPEVNSVTTPMWRGGFGVAPGGVIAPPAIRVVPGVKLVPPAPPAPPAKAVEKKAEPKKEAPKADTPKKDEKPMPVPAVKVKVAIGRVVIGGGPAIALPALPPGGGPFVPFNMQGLSLQDAKGKDLPAQIQVDWMKAKAGGGFGGFGPGSKMDYIATYRPQKGQPAEPTKLVFTGRKPVEVTVPFTLKDVELKK